MLSRLIENSQLWNLWAVEIEGFLMDARNEVIEAEQFRCEKHIRQKAMPQIIAICGITFQLVGVENHGLRSRLCSSCAGHRLRALCFCFLSLAALFLFALAILRE